MPRLNPLHRAGLAAAAALILVFAIIAVPATAGAADDDEHQVIRVRSEIECAEGEDCTGKTARHVVFVDGEDGEMVHLTAEDLHWVGEDGELTVEVDLGDHAANVMALHRDLAGGGFLGIGLTRLTPELRAHYGAPDDAGVLVSKVMDDSPAWRAGLAVGDVVTRVDGEAVASENALAHAVRGHEAGETVSLEVIRDGRLETFAATVEERPARHIQVRHFGGDSLDLCPEGGECRVEVTCDGGDCDCLVNGAEADCTALHLGDE